MKHVLVLYHSQSGASEQLARAAARGAACEDEVETRLLQAFEADARDLQRSDGVLFATPENFGYLAGGMKDFFDRSYYAARSETRSWPYALIVSAGNDGRGAQRQLERIVAGYPMRAIAEPLIVRGEPGDAHLHAAAELGQALAAGLALGIF